MPAYLGPDHPDPARRDALAFDHWADLCPEDRAVWLNPPYLPARTLDAFLARAVATSRQGRPVVALIPSATGTGYFQRHVLDGGARVEFLPGRIAFTGPHGTGTPARWASALVEWPVP